MSEQFVNLVVGLAVALSSGGLWKYLISKTESKSQSLELLRGLAHYQIVTECMRYISCGRITKNEYESLHTYLYEPFVNLGGNGLTAKLMRDVEELPIVQNNDV